MMEVLLNLTVRIISQYICASNHRAVHLICTQHEVSVGGQRSQKEETTDDVKMYLTLHPRINILPKNQSKSFIAKIANTCTDLKLESSTEVLVH